MDKITKKLARCGIISALYVVLSLITLPICGSAIQLRISEGLTILCLFYPEACFSMFFGCLITNLISGSMVLDIIFGSLISFIAGILTFAVGRVIKKAVLRVIIGGLFPVLLNAFLLPLIWYFCYGKLEYLYILQVAFLVASQGISVYGVGGIIYLAIEKGQKSGQSFLM